MFYLLGRCVGTKEFETKVLFAASIVALAAYSIGAILYALVPGLHSGAYSLQPNSANIALSTGIVLNNPYLAGWAMVIIAIGNKRAVLLGACLILTISIVERILAHKPKTKWIIHLLLMAAIFPVLSTISIGAMTSLSKMGVPMLSVADRSISALETHAANDDVKLSINKEDYDQILHLTSGRHIEVISVWRLLNQSPLGTLVGAGFGSKFKMEYVSPADGSLVAFERDQADFLPAHVAMTSGLPVAILMTLALIYFWLRLLPSSRTAKGSDLIILLFFLGSLTDTGLGFNPTNPTTWAALGYLTRRFPVNFSLSIPKPILDRFLRPEALMIVVSLLVGVSYAAVPIQYLNHAGYQAWTFIALGVVLFSFGSLYSQRVMRFSEPRAASPANINSIIAVCAILGFVGMGSLLIDKFVLSDIDWSAGIRAVRDRNAERLLSGESSQPHSIFIYVSYATLSFCCVAFSLFLLEGERISRAAGFLGILSTLPQVSYAIIYGGRTPILILLVIVASTALIRRLQGRTIFPRGWFIAPTIVASLFAFVIYTNAIFSSSRTGERLSGFNGFIEYTLQKWSVRPHAWLIGAVNNGLIDPQTAMNGISVGMYLTHGPTTVEKLINHRDGLSAYAGLYQVGVLSPLADTFFPSLGIPAKMRKELVSAGAYGWYPTAWGAWLMDAGFLLAIPCILLWGLLSGLAYQFARSGGLPGALMLVFAYVTIFLSPIQGPFGVANSFLIFCAFSVVAAYLRFSRMSSQKAALDYNHSGIT
mgnify:CR=1 FL=1